MYQRRGSPKRLSSRHSGRRTEVRWDTWSNHLLLRQIERGDEEHF
jgi:hypothetical protein